jgi:DNA polymerase II small subunit
LYLNEDIIRILERDALSEINWLDFEKTCALSQRKGEDRPYNEFLNYMYGRSIAPNKKNVKIISSYPELSSKREVQDFAMYFNSRLDSIQKILSARGELSGVVSISRLLNKRERENVSLIGIVKDKQTTKNNNIILVLEDSTGEIKALVNKNKADLHTLAKDIVMDEVIGVSGVVGDKIVFVNNLIFPDVPNTNELKKSEEEGYAVFLSDMHVGSNNFLEEDFNRFLAWLKQETGNEKQREISSKVKYVFIVGDLVDGVGVYPNQEEELVITDIYEQYKKCAELVAKIPKNITVIICAGNHDALRMSEPQPPLDKELCPDLYALPNVLLISNPSIVNIHSSDSFSGYNVLLYHGYSFDYYIANVDSIRNGGGYDRADLIMKFLLKRRHLAPSHTSTLYIPYTDKDPLVIDIIPDFFATGHIHKTAVSSYKNITLISGSCWQSKTAFQAKMGHHPEPSRVPIVNLTTREVKVLKFGK